MRAVRSRHDHHIVVVVVSTQAWYRRPCPPWQCLNICLPLSPLCVSLVRLCRRLKPRRRAKPSNLCRRLKPRRRAEPSNLCRRLKPRRRAEPAKRSCSLLPAAAISMSSLRPLMTQSSAGRDPGSHLFFLPSPTTHIPEQNNFPEPCQGGGLFNAIPGLGKRRFKRYELGSWKDGSVPTPKARAGSWTETSRPTPKARAMDRKVRTHSKGLGHGPEGPYPLRTRA